MMEQEPLWTWKGLLYSAIVGLILGFILSEAEAADRAFGVKGQTRLVIHEAPCANTTIQAHITRMGGAHLLDKFKSATLTYGGRDWQSCWVEIDGLVVSVDEEGSPLEPIEIARFREEGA